MSTPQSPNRPSLTPSPQPFPDNNTTAAVLTMTGVIALTAVGLWVFYRIYICPRPRPLPRHWDIELGYFASELPDRDILTEDYFQARHFLKDEEEVFEVGSVDEDGEVSEDGDEVDDDESVSSLVLGVGREFSSVEDEGEEEEEMHEVGAAMEGPVLARQVDPFVCDLKVRVTKLS